MAFWWSSWISSITELGNFTRHHILLLVRICFYSRMKIKISSSEMSKTGSSSRSFNTLEMYSKNVYSVSLCVTTEKLWTFSNNVHTLIQVRTELSNYAACSFFYTKRQACAIISFFLTSAHNLSLSTTRHQRRQKHLDLSNFCPCLYKRPQGGSAS